LGKFPGQFNGREFHLETEIPARQLLAFPAHRGGRRRPMFPSGSIGRSSHKQDGAVKKPWPYQSHAIINTMGVTTIFIVSSRNSPPQQNIFYFVCMILPGGGCRLQTCRDLVAQWFDSTLRTLGQLPFVFIFNYIKYFACTIQPPGGGVLSSNL
jgi:hypothetical protein